LTRGRKRKAGPRHKCGKLRIEPDKGTLATQIRRAWLANGGDPTLTGYPLGILLCNSEIDSNQHKAGCVYANAFRTAIRPPQIAAHAMERVAATHEPGIESDAQERAYKRQRELYQTGRGALQRVGVIRTVHNAVIYEAPEFMLPPRAWPAPKLLMIQEGLRELAIAYGFDRQRRAG